MNTIKLQRPYTSEVTVISNIFIDQYMPVANGEFVKIYLYLLRSLSLDTVSFQLSRAADQLSCTESDILRALRYWENAGILKLAFDESKQLQGIAFLNPSEAAVSSASESTLSESGLSESGLSGAALSGAALSSSALSGSALSGAALSGSALSGAALSNAAEAVPSTGTMQSTPSGYSPEKAAGTAVSGTDTDITPKRTAVSASKIKQFKENPEASQLLFISQQYLGKTLSATDISHILYFYEDLHFSTDLIEYLIEYCVSKGKKSMRYIETVALAWDKEGIRTVQAAKDASSTYSKQYYSILKALGIRKRDPIEPEIQIMDTWIKEYGFTLDIITEACTRTIQQTNQPSFQYADGILNRWRKQNVHHLSDIVPLDAQHKKAAAKNAKPQQHNNSGNSFNNVPQRNYDVSALEKQLLNQ